MKKTELAIASYLFPARIRYNGSEFTTIRILKVRRNTHINNQLYVCVNYIHKQL